MWENATNPLLDIISRYSNDKCRKVHYAVWSQEGKQTL